MTTDLDAIRLDAIVQRVVDRLPGDWLLVGGALVALSARDFEDCLELLRRCQRDGLEVDTRRVRSELTALVPVDDAALTARRQRLQAGVDGLLGALADSS
jgi:hypothetical protein